LDNHDLIHAILEDRDHLPSRQIPSGSVFQFQGEFAEHIGIILSGRVFAQASTQEGYAIWLEEFGQNQLVGIESVFSGAPLGYELIAKTDVKIIYFTKEKFLALINSQPTAIELVLEEVASRLIQNTVRLIEANSLSAKGRICAELKRHSKPIGVEPDKFIIRPIPVFSEFALRVGSTRESVSRTVSDMAKFGVIERETGALIIPDMKKFDSYIK